MGYLLTVNLSSLNKLEVLQKEFDGLKKNLEEKRKLLEVREVTVIMFPFSKCYLHLYANDYLMHW